MAKVGIVMGSDSDLKVMSKAADMLEELGIEYELTIISAHREPDELIEWTRGAENRDVKVIIAGAGMAAALPGMCAALFALPVIGVPLSGKNLDGMDAVFSIMQMRKMQQSLQQRYSQQVMMQSLRRSKSIQQI
jgi:5-(carboxyamino)imidazole ribonucleotide mutase